MDIKATATISLNLYVDHIEWLKEVASNEDRSVSSLVRKIIGDEINWHIDNMPGDDDE